MLKNYYEGEQPSNIGMHELSHQLPTVVEQGLEDRNRSKYEHISNPSYLKTKISVLEELIAKLEAGLLEEDWVGKILLYGLKLDLVRMIMLEVLMGLEGGQNLDNLETSTSLIQMEILASLALHESE